MKFLLVVFWILLLNCTINKVNEQPPNILIILTDDQGYGDISINGNPEVDTPHMDAFAMNSVRLHDYHAQPVCAPSRAQLMTGRHALTTGVWGVHGGRDYLNLDEFTIAQLLQGNGYETYMLGKWHLGKEAPYLPEQRGFDEAWVQANLYEHQNPIIKHKGNELAPKAWTVDYLTDTAINVFARVSDSPKFMYLAYPQIHKPYIAPDSLIEKYIAQGHSDAVASIYGITEQLDQNIGRLLRVLEQSGKLENTLIFFIGDNGPIWNNPPASFDGLPALPEEEAARNPLNLAGVKGRLHENGHRTIGFVKWGNMFEARDEYQMVDIADIFPTIMEVLDILLPVESKPLFGESILPILNGETQDRNRAYYYSNHEVLWENRPYQYAFLEDKKNLLFDEQELAIRKGKYKYIQGYFGKKLFNLEEDLQETIDISLDYPEIRMELESELKEWWEETVINESNSYDMPVFYLGINSMDSTYIHGAAPYEVFGDIYTSSHNTQNWTNNGDGIAQKFIVQNFGIYEFIPDWELGTSDAELEVTLRNQRSSYLLSEMEGLNIPLLTVPLEPGEYQIEIRIRNSTSESEAAIKAFNGIIVQNKD
ncbi:MAG: sulfatase-like hydrolase/transferase [Balneolaceae bacterium]